MGPVIAAVNEQPLVAANFWDRDTAFVLSSADFDLLLDYKCIWFLLTDRWGLEPETGDLRAGQQNAAVTTAGPQGTAVRTFGKETPAEIGDDETIICSKLVEMKGSSSQLVMNIGGRALTLVRSQLGQTDLLKKQIHYFVALEMLAEPVIKIGEKDFRFTELFRYVV